MKRTALRATIPKDTPLWWKWESYAWLSYAVIVLMKTAYVIDHPSTALLYFKISMGLQLLLGLAMLIVLCENLIRKRTGIAMIAILLLCNLISAYIIYRIVLVSDENIRFILGSNNI